MRIITLIVTFAALSLGGASMPAAAQVVQLPSIHTFSYSGSVLVPDSGSASLGSVNSYGAGRQSRSRLGSRASGSQIGAGGASAHVTIIDLDAMDREILGYDPKQRRAEQSSSRRSLSSVNRTDEGKQLVRFARAQFQIGNRGGALDAYRMAIEILPSGLRQLATAEMHRVFPSGAVHVMSARALPAK